MTVFHDLVSIEEAIVAISRFRWDHVENLKIENSIGRILAEDVISVQDSPPFDRSEMDGFAVFSEDLKGAEEDKPITLKLQKQTAKVGAMPDMLEEGCAMKIATGAPIPANADAVIMVEYTKSNKNTVTFYRSASPGENISQAGSDVMMGEMALKKDSIIGSREVGILAAIGKDTVNVKKLIKVALLSTGNEVEVPGSALTPGHVNDVNSFVIITMINAIPGYDAEFKGILRDDYQIFKSHISGLMAEYPIIVTSGSTSAGEGDMIYRVFEELGSLLFHGLKVKPGKPTVCAMTEKNLLIGLPGFPLSASMIFKAVLEPAMKRIMGLREYTKNLEAKLAFKTKGAFGKNAFYPVTLVKKREEIIAYPLLGDSGSITKLAYADAYIKVPANMEFLEENSSVKAYLLEDDLKISNMNFIGSHDLLVDLLISMMRSTPYVKIINTGSMGGLMAIKRGEATLSGVHLLNLESMKYNDFNIPGIKVIRGYDRMQGIAYRKDTNIKKFEDVIPHRFINRNNGSGTRVLIDYYLKQISEKQDIEFKDLTKKIKGYTIEAKTHTAVGAAIKNGRADVGITVEYVAKLYNLSFIPLKKEEYDFLVRSESLGDYYVQDFIETLKSKEFNNLVKSYPGYKIPSNTGAIKY